MFFSETRCICLDMCTNDHRKHSYLDADASRIFCLLGLGRVLFVQKMLGKVVEKLGCVGLGPASSTHVTVLQPLNYK